MKNTKIQLVVAICLLSIMPLTASAIVDTNYTPLDLSSGEVVAESPAPVVDEGDGEESQAQAEAQAVAAPETPAAPAVIPVETSSPPTKTVSTTSVAAPRESAGEVLGVAKERDPLEKAYKLLDGKFNDLFENYGELQVELALLRASAEKTHESDIMERSGQNIVYVIFAVILASIMLFIEIKYTKFLPRLVMSHKTDKKKRQSKTQRR